VEAGIVAVKQTKTIARGWDDKKKQKSQSVGKDGALLGDVGGFRDACACCATDRVVRILGAVAIVRLSGCQREGRGLAGLLGRTVVVRYGGLVIECKCKKKRGATHGGCNGMSRIV
jgi:hypothetical protein